MRELDFWFLNFLDHAYADSPREQQLTFQRLLGYQDQEIFEWMMDTATPMDTDLREIIVLIRETSTTVAKAKADD